MFKHILHILSQTKKTTTNTLCSCMQTDPVPTSHDRSSNRLLQKHWPTSDWHEGYKISSKNCYQNQKDLFHGWHLSIYVHPNAQCDVTPFSKKCFFNCENFATINKILFYQTLLHYIFQSPVAITTPVLSIRKQKEKAKKQTYTPCQSNYWTCMEYTKVLSESGLARSASWPALIRPALSRIHRVILVQQTK